MNTPEIDRLRADTPILNTVEAAAYLRLSPKTLEKDRLTHGIGIPFRRHGRRIVYHRDDLADFSKSMAVAANAG